jgi:hypothetical protein
MARRILSVAALLGFGLVGCPAIAAANIGCRAIGLEARQGETLCIRTPEGLRLAECGMNLNVSNWTFRGACMEPSSPEAQRPQPPPADPKEN